MSLISYLIYIYICTTTSYSLSNHFYMPCTTFELFFECIWISVNFIKKYILFLGYGHVAPLSEGGKIFCIVYALIGIPLTLILLTAYVERLLIPTTLFLQFLNSRLGHLYQPFHIRIGHLTCVGVSIFLCVFYYTIKYIFLNINVRF